VRGARKSGPILDENFVQNLEPAQDTCGAKQLLFLANLLKLIAVLRREYLCVALRTRKKA
jgi:hypothetical protein